MSDPKDKFKEVLYTVDKEGRRKWVYAAVVDGVFRQRRKIVAYSLIALYIALPWITINGEPGILLDLVHQKFVFFGQVFWATDALYLLLVLMIFGFGLFLFTALFGRVWCGWACPETVFLEFLFRPIERWIEGSHLQQMKLDQGPWTFEKITKKIIKHFISALIAWILASTFLAYFIGQEPLLKMMSQAPWENPFEFSMTFLLMGAMAFQFGWFREQFCTVVCPYGRFQSVLLDDHSIIVGYDQTRGEPRGKIRSQNPSPKGDCIDCLKCINVCPTGIDIRNGLQMECVNCTACIDACDDVMTRINRPKGLIRLASEKSLAGEKTQFLRPRVYVYFFLVLIFTGVLIFKLSSRSLAEFQILRSGKGKTFELISTQNVRNHLHLRLANKGASVKNFKVELHTPAKGLKLIVPINPYPVSGNSIQTLPLFLEFPTSLLVAGKKMIAISIYDGDELVGTQEVTLLGPGI